MLPQSGRAFRTARPFESDLPQGLLRHIVYCCYVEFNSGSHEHGSNILESRSKNMYAPTTIEFEIESRIFFLDITLNSNKMGRSHPRTSRNSRMRYRAAKPSRNHYRGRTASLQETEAWDTHMLSETFTRDALEEIYDKRMPQHDINLHLITAILTLKSEIDMHYMHAATLRKRDFIDNRPYLWTGA